MSAILFGSISTLADTSELQRDAFNRAFAEHDLDWHWDSETYRQKLAKSGGRDRIAEEAVSQGEPLDADAVHATKSSLFQDSLREADLEPRPGVADTIRAAKEAGLRLGLVTTTSPDNVRALLDTLAPAVSADDFDVIVDVTSVEHAKPRADAYHHALEQLGEAAGSCVAIEDNVGGVQAATAAGVACVAFPNANTASHDFAPAPRVEQLSIDELRSHLGGDA